MSESGCSSVSIECSLCSLNGLSTPESLCAHMQQRHSMNSAVIEYLHFDDVHTFQRWLESVEDSRCERSGYVPREGDRGTANDNEYYLLCRRRSPVLKRRRLANGHTRNSLVSTKVSVQPVACTAFVHVVESLSGWVSVRYCLEHCGHSVHHTVGNRAATRSRRCPDEAACSSSQGSTLGHLKRNSSSILNDSEDEDYASEEYVSEESMEEETRQSNLNASLLDGLMEGISSSGISCEPTSGGTSTKVTVAERKAILGTIESELAATKADVSSIKDTVSDESCANIDALISERLDSAADRLRALTKMLADLAIGIRASNNEVVTS